jgi:YD repeat-containing protein
LVQPDGQIAREHTYAYDDKKTPLPKLPLLSVPRYVIPDLPGKGLSSHNIKTHTWLKEDGQRSATTSFTATYTYNEAGYPIAATNTFEDGSVEHTVYTYTIK